MTFGVMIRGRALGSDWAHGSKEEGGLWTQGSCHQGLRWCNWWCEVPLYGEAEIEGAKIIEAIDSMERITIPERYRILGIPECIEQPKVSFGLTLKPTPEPGAATSNGVAITEDLGATIGAIVERQVNKKLVEVLEKILADLKASLGR